jgi:hypothetical protein
MAKNKSIKAMNVGKEIEAMKHLMLHHIASSLQRFWFPALIQSQDYRFYNPRCQQQLLDDSSLTRRPF